MSSDPKFGAGYDAIFGKKPNTGTSPVTGTHAPETTATVSEVRGWLRTEDPAWLDNKALADIKSKLETNDASLWRQPIEVAEIDGVIHVFNGHHRLSAAVEAGYAGKIPYQKIAPPKDFTVGDHFGPFGAGN
jgi:hypothetical protein